MWADNYWVMSHLKAHLEQMIKDLIQEAERRDLEPKPASLWWTSTYDSEEKMDLSIDTKTRRHRKPFEDNFKVLGFTLNRQGKTQDSLEERIENANEAWWRDATFYRSKDIPWRVKCRRMVKHVYSVFCCGSENWSWRHASLDIIEGWETKAMRRVFRFKKKKRR